MKLPEAIEKAKVFYKDIGVPNTVTEYMANSPPGLSRTTLKAKLDLTAGQFLSHIGSSYQEQVPTIDKLRELMKERKHVLLNKVDSCTKNTPLSMECSKGHKFNTYWGTYRITKVGCKACASNLELKYRKEEIDNRASLLGSKVLEYPESQQKRVHLKCLGCGEEYSILGVKLMNPNTDNEGTCPNCRITDTRVTFEGITFGSQFERECYKLLKHLNPKLQVRYSHTFNTTRRWVCDFVIGDVWVEVSSFRKDSKGYNSYLSNIEEKREIVESHGLAFKYLTSLREVKDFINKI